MTQTNPHERTESPRSDATAPPSVEDSDAEYLSKFGYTQELKRALGLFSSFGVQFTSISVGSVLFTTLAVGLGFFGPASFWPFIVGGSLQVFAVGLAVAQLVSAYPLSGGVYQIVGRVAPRYPWLAWQSGWWLITAHVVAVSALAVSMVPFITGWFGITGLSNFDTAIWAGGIILLVTLVNLAGVKASAILNNLGVIAELAIIVLVVVALVFFKYDRAPASIIFDTGGTVSGGGWALVPFLFAMILPAFAISSFDATGNAAEETKNAARNAALGTVLANSVALFSGAIFFYLLLRAIPSVDGVMSASTPVKYILDSSVGEAVTTVFEAVAIVALLACIAMLQLTAVRVLWAQARDRQLPAAGWFHKLNGNKIPINASLVVALLSMLVCFWSSLLAVLSAMTALAWAMAYGSVVIMALPAVIRKRLPAHPFNLKAASVPVFVVAVVWSILLCVLLVWSDWVNVGLGMAAVVVVGFLIYATIPAEHRGKTAAAAMHNSKE